jgi:hypothetical protein
VPRRWCLHGNAAFRNHAGQSMNLRILVLVLFVFTLPGCKTQSAMTARATDCRTISIDIVKSRYSREGSTTVWCAKCKNKLYQCVSNPDHSRVECKEAGPDMCE